METFVLSAQVLTYLHLGPRLHPILTWSLFLATLWIMDFAFPPGVNMHSHYLDCTVTESPYANQVDGAD